MNRHEVSLLNCPLNPYTIYYSIKLPYASLLSVYDWTPSQVLREHMNSSQRMNSAGCVVYSKGGYKVQLVAGMPQGNQHRPGVIMDQEQSYILRHMYSIAIALAV